MLTWLSPSRLRRLALALAALGAVMLAGAAPSPGDPDSQIAFTRPDGIYVMHADGSGVRALRRGGPSAHAFGLAWSPDGRRLAFATGKAIWAIDADGGRLVRVVRSADPTLAAPLSPTWSPDGRSIAFTASARGERDVWAVDADGGHLRRLLHTPGRPELEVDWSPAGGRFAVVWDVWTANVYVVDAQGRKLRKLTPKPTGPAHFWASDPEWSPDGRRVAFMYWQRAFREAEIYTSDAAGRALVHVTRNAVPEGHPTWSPDGRRIAFLRWTAGSQTVCLDVPAGSCGPSDVYVAGADGTGLKRLTHTRAAEGSPAWQPVAPS